MHQTHSRPIGPRTLPRSQSPLPPLILPETRPLVIRQRTHDQPALHPSSVSSSPPPLGSSPGPSRPQIPGALAPGPRPNQRPKLHLPIALDGATSSAGYYEGPAIIPPGLDGENPGGATVRPFLTLQTPRPPEPIDGSDNSIAQLIAEFDKTTIESYTYTPTEETSTNYSSNKWSDGVLEVLSRLGEGQGGAVHKVRDRRNNFILARKTITTREAPLKQLERELSISATSKHHNIIRFHGAYMSPSSSEVKVMMEYCAGRSLEAVGKRIKEKNARISEKVAGRIAEGVLQGLSYLHSLKTIHRDIKPSNILLTGEGVVRLCDFGVSGELVRSMAGTFTGTSFYMAPERISGKEYSIRADVWSTGITLLELVQNRYPFPEDLTSIELIVYITQGQPPQLTDEESDNIVWSDEMKDFIRQTLIIDHQIRPTPGGMLSHPWITNVMRREVPMARWISQVWDWPKQTREANSRPPSSRGAVDRTP
ncbi:kinase-like domain-containing protein [Suillus subalutaceus]|uniref:kinase-like domain-containing protein n=1 Tax=Suillus subalutaceus TaxID=48586 RepID=UPI001B86C9A1|nr:kinase-like domain-containing protein [Suillus subalutaceus]KAG1862550.1 kinase-like domain-containing protein [Suillus subalutaceus]